MARQINYDPLHVRRCLLRQFWLQGYAETSLSRLEEASGLDRRQLYNGLGDKRAMFLQALDDFQEIAGRRFLSPLEAPTAGVSNIQNLLQTFAALAATEEGRNGCLICITSQEDISEDPDVKKRIEGYFDRIQEAYRNALMGASARGEIRLLPDEAERLSAFLFGIQVSMSVLARAGQPAARIQALADQAMRVIG